MPIPQNGQTHSSNCLRAVPSFMGLTLKGLNELSTSYVQFKFESSLLWIYYCSKSHHGWVNKVSWLNKVLWNCYFLMKLSSLWVNYFFKPLLFNVPYFFKADIRFRKRYFSMLFFRTANFRLLTLFWQLHSLFII